MCISVFLWQSHPLYQFFLLHNRDEYHDRPTEALSWWDNENIVGGRDGLAGGTWLACSKFGRLGFVSNVRENSKIAQPKSRGELIVRFLKSRKTPLEFAEEIMEEANQYNGFNLIIADLPMKSMIYVTNRPIGDMTCISMVTPGIHVLTNANLDTPWPKAERLRHNFDKLSREYGEDEFPVMEMVDKLMLDKTKDEDRSVLPHTYSPEWEYQLSSVYVDAETSTGRYGTRSIAALSVTADRLVSFYERSLEKNVWKEKTVPYGFG